MVQLKLHTQLFVFYALSRLTFTYGYSNHALNGLNHAVEAVYFLSAVSAVRLSFYDEERTCHKNIEVDHASRE